MRYLILSGCVLLCIHSEAQQLSPQSISTAGKSSATGGILLESETGGFAVSSFYGTTYLYTQGFLQPEAGTTSSVQTPPSLANTLGVGVDNGGSTFINGNIMLEFTTGEFASKTLNAGSSLLTQGILQPYSIGGVLPVTGLEFYAKRISNTQVQLNWKTLQELNNKGFTIERQKENENAFADIDFVGSYATAGNSSDPLQYQQLDNNNFSGITYYRLRQQDLDGHSSYSVIRTIKGAEGKQLTMQVWPVPAVGFFNVNVTGLTKADILQVLDMNGRLVKKFTIENNNQQQVNGLPAGTYYVKLASDNTVGQKVIVQ